MKRLKLISEPIRDGILLSHIPSAGCPNQAAKALVEGISPIFAVSKIGEKGQLR
jgi:hypothetical protein